MNSDLTYYPNLSLVFTKAAYADDTQDHTDEPTATGGALGVDWEKQSSELMIVQASSSGYEGANIA